MRVQQKIVCINRRCFRDNAHKWPGIVDPKGRYPQSEREDSRWKKTVRILYAPAPLFRVENSGGEKINKTKTRLRLLSCVYTLRYRWREDEFTQSKYVYEKINHTLLLCNVVTYVGHKCNTERVQRVCFCFVRETKGVHAAPEMHRARCIWTASAAAAFIPGKALPRTKTECTRFSVRYE